MVEEIDGPEQSTTRPVLRVLTFSPTAAGGGGAVAEQPPDPHLRCTQGGHQRERECVLPLPRRLTGDSGCDEFTTSTSLRSSDIGDAQVGA